MGSLLEMMATNKAASEKSCKEMLRMMGQQQMRTRIPRFMLDDVERHTRPATSAVYRQ